MFDKSIEYGEETQTIKLKGDLDIYAEDDFKSFISDNLDIDKDVIFDLAELDYLDSTGLGMFMNVYNDQKNNDKTVKIINVKDNIYKLFKITDLTGLFGME